jgi:hypothetical protein
VEVPPSPKVQALAVTFPPWSKLVFTKVQTAPAQLKVNLATGGGFAGGVGSTAIVFVATAVAPSLSVTVSVTVNSVVTVTLYVCDGLSPSAVLPSPKVQVELAMVPGATSVLVLTKVQTACAQL